MKHLAILFAAIFMMAACQKEYSVETGSLGGLAEGTLKDSLGDCQPITVTGPIIVDSTLNDSSYVTLQVNITSPGSYTIFTDNQNGYSFRDSGYIADTGLVSVQLKATGKPLLPIISDFTVSFGSSFCLFSVTAVNGVPAGPIAAFTLSGTATNCTNAVVSGNYTAGTSLNSTNTVDIEVNVTTAGSYSITTALTNGMTFSKSGTLATGIQTITLQGTGIPDTSGAVAVPIAAGGTSCSFTVNVAPGAPANINLADSAWQFTQGASTYHGTLDSVVFSKQGPLDVLQFYGLTFSTRDSSFVLAVAMTSSSIQSGTYNTSTFAAFNFGDFNSADSTITTIYEADQSTAVPPGILTIVLTYDAVTKIAQGTFTGTAHNATGASVPITNGKFRAVVP